MEQRYILKENIKNCPFEDICGDFSTMEGALAALHEETEKVFNDEPKLRDSDQWFYEKNKNGAIIRASLVKKDFVLPHNVKPDTPEYECAIQDEADQSFSIITCPSNVRGRYYAN